MIIHDYDINTQSLISLEKFYGEPKKLTKKCLILFSKVIHDYLIENFIFNF